MMIDSNGDIRIDCKHRPRGNVLVDFCEALADKVTENRIVPLEAKDVLEAIEAFERKAP